MLKFARLQSSIWPTLNLQRRWRNPATTTQAEWRLFRDRSKKANQIAAPSQLLRHTISKQGNVHDVLDLLRTHVAADSADFGKALERCGELKDFDALLKVIQLAKTRGINMNSDALCTMIEAASRCTTSSTSAQAVTIGKQAWQEIRAEGFQARAGHYKAALALCLEARDLPWARELWSELPKASVNSTHLILYLKTVALCEPTTGWTSVLQDIRKARLSGPELTESLLCELLVVAAFQHDSKVAKTLWLEMSNIIKLTQESFAAYAMALMLGREASQVPKLTREMVNLGLKPKFVNFLYEAQALLLLLNVAPSCPQTYSALQMSITSGLEKAHEERTSARELRKIQKLGDELKDQASRPSSDVQLLWAKRWPK